MAGEKKIVNAEPVAVGLDINSCAKLPKYNKASKKDGIPSNLNATSNIEGDTDQESVVVRGVNCQPSSCYNYYYPGFNGAFTQLDDQGYFNGDVSYTGLQSENGSFLYYLPGYNPYATGAFMGVDGQPPYFSSSGYIQHPVSYGSESMSCYSWDSTYSGNFTNASAKSGSTKPVASSNEPAKSNSNTSASKTTTLPFNSKSQQSTVSPNFSKPTFQTQPLKPFNKQLSSGLQSEGLVKSFHPVRKFSSFSNQNSGLFAYNGPSSYRHYGRVWNGNTRFKLREKYDKNGEFEPSTELTCGPRTHSKNNSLDSSKEDEHLEFTVLADQDNIEIFQTQYNCAKFFVIKSYSEDDVHKCIKYDVWSSTPNGNKKLDAALHDAETKASESGARCPIFLFFSVNASGQFIGVAEMIGKVDFNKSMDFWQQDKWNGSFPVKWHIVKDIPNTQLRHIILENNDNRPVTYSRDTQEIGLKQGLEMLKIFKSYLRKTSVIDDFNFYEDREKSLRARKNGKAASAYQTERDKTTGIDKHVKAAERLAVKGLVTDKDSSDPAPLVNLAKNLSFNSQPAASNPVINPIENSVPTIPATEG